ncbi:MAG: DUF2249 domain-containing protein [Candidatus Competibacteraceae bacterium]|nr:DUF2249 domain-containing protein [Candidatus Competibacteraceae bacterium]
MISIHPDTRIDKLIKAHPDALEAIVSLSPSFEKLRNPLLRKLMTPRTSIRMACKVGGCSIEDFMQKMASLGFEIEQIQIEDMQEQKDSSMPEVLKAIEVNNLVEMDVRPMIASGNDPLEVILKQIGDLPSGHALKIINTFEPVPLIHLLKKKGFDSYVEHTGDVILTYFYHRATEVADVPREDAQAVNWDDAIQRFDGKFQTVDVRNLEMPLPMISILEAIQQLEVGQALFVYHKRIPVYLLPELYEKGYSYATKEISENEIHLIIFKE